MLNELSVLPTISSLGKMVLQMLGSFAEFERGLIVERVTRGIEAKLARGLPLAVVGYGLTKSATGVVEPDPATFGVVQRIFRAYTQDRLGTKAIAMRLQADGLSTPGQRPWSVAAVARILRNRAFVGELPFRDGWVPGAHEPLIDAETFAAAQGQADERAKPRTAAQAKSSFLLSGHCGGVYSSRTAELVTELDAARARITALELAVATAEVALVPTEEDREALRNVLAQSLHTGPGPVRKALFTALVERIEVHSYDDIRPTFRLYDLTVAALVIEDDAVANTRVNPFGIAEFASRRTGWSLGDSNS